MQMNKLTADQREIIISEIFNRYSYGSGLRILNASVPEASENTIFEFVNEAFNALIEWNYNA